MDPPIMWIFGKEAMTVFVGRGLHRSRILRSVLQWGYARGTLELTKSV